MKYFICKMCGRAGRFNEQPICCYADRMDAIEGISDEDAIKMGINIPDGETFEFPGDIKWNPVSGEPMTASGKTVEKFQNSIMTEVRSCD